MLLPRILTYLGSRYAKELYETHLMIYPDMLWV